MLSLVQTAAFLLSFIALIPSVSSSLSSMHRIAFITRASHRSVKRQNLLSTQPLFSTTNNTITNYDLVQQQLAVMRAKKQARFASNQRRHERQLKLKHTQQPLIAIRVSACPALRHELKLNGREKRGRMFVEQESNATTHLKEFKQELHGFFRCLKKSTYVLEASLPRVMENGTIVSSESNWTISTDSDLEDAFAKALNHYQNVTQSAKDSVVLKRPTVFLHVSKDPSYVKEPLPWYMQSVPANPYEEADSMTMLSFYSFDRIDDPFEFCIRLRKSFTKLGARGRIYVAPTEGINAQLSVPTFLIDNFVALCHDIPELTNMENGVNVDPHPIPKLEFDKDPPFIALHVRVRNQIVSDGLDEELDWSSAGYDMPPMEWHNALQQSQTKQPMLLDCRNDYESQVGRFQGAIPLNTTTFRDTWDALEEKLKDTPKDAPIMTYCTGGIRCVKVGAYLTQEMGFTNVSRLAGGIVAYDRTLQEEAPEEASLFRGTNFVFDGRLGRSITSEALGTCISCGAATNNVDNCKNPSCHKRMVQCAKCQTKYSGTCSDACHLRLQNSAMLLKRRETDNDKTALGASEQETDFATLEDYAVGHSTAPDTLFEEIQENTRAHLASGSHMVSGPSQGRFLSMLASMSGSGRVLECGTFTGYATAWLLQGASSIHNVKPGSRDKSGAYVLTMERDERALDLAAAHLSIISSYGFGSEAAKAASELRDNVPQVDQDSQYLTYNDKVGCEILRVTDALATLEEMATNPALSPREPFDIVFVDADKTRLLEYVEACVANDAILRKGGLIVVDNVLWKGLVLSASRNFEDLDEIDVTEPDSKKSRRARKLALKMHRFNSEVLKDNRVEVLVLPVRDGLSVIRKR